LLLLVVWLKIIFLKKKKKEREREKPSNFKGLSNRKEKVKFQVLKLEPFFPCILNEIKHHVFPKVTSYD
jgi:hypothetical protein